MPYNRDAHIAGMTAAQDGVIWAFNVNATPAWQEGKCTEAEFAEYYAALTATAAVQSFTVVDNASGAIVGNYSYLDVTPRHRTVEIGNIWLGPAGRGKGINTEVDFAC